MSTSTTSPHGNSRPSADATVERNRVPVARRRGRLCVAVAIGVASALSTGCSRGDGASATSSSPASTGGASTTSRPPEPTDGGGTTTSVTEAPPPEVPLGPGECGTYSGTGCASDSERIDLSAPTFSDPTSITNPLFPISDLDSVVLLGTVEGQRFRSETTLLPGTSTVRWNGEEIETLVSQYTAYRDGRIEEVALDRYAQADDGSVWYLGEDVVDYVDGHIATTEGTWLAGREGPPAMIMPADPQLGDVYRAENVPGIVFEEVRVKRVGERVKGPLGQVTGAMVGEELHLDETTEEKIFAPGYGEFSTGSGDDFEALAVAVPTDALTSPMPDALPTLAVSATGMLGAAQGEDWDAAASIVERMRANLAALPVAEHPRTVVEQLTSAIDALADAVKAEDPVAAGQAAIDVSQSVLDLQLRYRPSTEINTERLELWARQILIHAAGDDAAGVAGDVATLEWIRDRIAHTLAPDALAELETRLAALRVAADDGRLSAAADHAARLANRMRSLTGPG